MSEVRKTAPRRRRRCEGTLVVAASGASTRLFAFARRIPAAVWATLGVVFVTTPTFVLLHRK